MAVLTRTHRRRMILNGVVLLHEIDSNNILGQKYDALERYWRINLITHKVNEGRSNFSSFTPNK